MTAMQIAMQRALRDYLERRVGTMRDQRARLLADRAPCEAKTREKLREVETDLIRLQSILEAADNAA